jgi:ABC-type transport system involved in multi-copper enzyme maturation permease subunit
MKFLAMLRDSLRETLDVKLFYVMIGLSLLVCLIIGSVTYKPVPMQERLEVQMGLVNFLIRTQLQSDPQLAGLDVHLSIDDFQQTNTTPEPWLGDYQFFYTFTITDQNETKPAGIPAPEVRDNKEKTEKFKKTIHEQLSEKELQRQFEGLFKHVQVKSVEAPDLNQVRFLVTTQGTIATIRRQWFHKPSLFFGLLPLPVPVFTLNDEVSFFTNWVVGTGGASFTLLVSTIITAFFLPNMLAKGTVDLLIVKPMHRVTILLYKFFGGLSFMFLNTVIIMFGVWCGLGIQTGVWLNSFLLCILIYTFQFAILYSLSAVVSVLTRSMVVSILASLMLWGLLIILGWTHWIFIERGRSEKAESTRSHWAYIGYDALHAVLPQFKDLDWLTTRMIRTDLAKPDDPNNKDQQDAYEKERKQLEKEDYYGYSWTSALTTGTIFIAIMLGISCWRFSAKDY